MNLSDLSSYATLGLGIPTVLIWLGNFIRWIRNKYKVALSEEVKSRKTASSLLNEAKSTENKHELYSYITLQTMKFNNRKIQHHIDVKFSNLFTFILLIIFILLFKFNYIDIHDTSFLFLMITFITYLTSLIIHRYYLFKINKIENGFIDGIMEEIVKNKL